MRFSANSIAAAGLLVILSGSLARAATVQPGDPAPEFSLVDTGGTSHTLSQYRGKLVLLWPRRHPEA